ncbi:MAG TPA: hypothetical protein PK875_10190, partial [Spirochaetota bacterium]|nr:hypothetical protein [Spirochaetota bacterium]
CIRRLVMFEALMLVCFGVSWPASIYKSIKLKDVRAKSKLFLWLVLAGYGCGIVNKILNGIDWVIFFYIAVGILVLVDLILYYYYSSRSEKTR